MTAHPRIRPLLAAVLTTTVLAVAACGDDPATSGASAADRDKQARDAQLKFAGCMRAHGIDMEDPKPGERGIRLMEPKGVSPQKLRDAQQACQKYLDEIKPPELTDEQQKEFQEAALAHARCMREHGIDFPDPTFGEDGRAQIRIDKRSGINPDDPKFQEAQKACESELPKLGGEGPSTDEAKP